MFAYIIILYLCLLTVLSTICVYLGVIHNYHHFHKRTNRTLGGGGGMTWTYAFFNVEK